MKPVYYVDDAGQAVSDIPKGAFVQRVPGTGYYLEKRHPDSDVVPLIYATEVMNAMAFHVSDGMERTEIYLDPLWAISAWRTGMVFKVEE